MNETSAKTNLPNHPFINESKMEGFGVPCTYGTHHFKVEIPSVRTNDVTIIEDYGYAGDQNGIPKDELRVRLKRATWSGIRDAARREFNERLKAAKLAPSSWHEGPNKVDRLLGKELCVLAWAAENADSKLLPIISSRWLALRKEERWWLFSMTVAQSGLAEDRERGWRKALFYALSDGEKPSQRKRMARSIEQESIASGLFEASEEIPLSGEETSQGDAEIPLGGGVAQGDGVVLNAEKSKPRTTKKNGSKSSPSEPNAQTEPKTSEPKKAKENDDTSPSFEGLFAGAK